MFTTRPLVAFRSAALRLLAGVSLLLWGLAAGASAASGDIVLYATDAGPVRGNWAAAPAVGAAGGGLLQSRDTGWSSLTAPLAAPADFFEASFAAPTGVRYHVWLRLRAAADSKYNDSVWVQFSDAADASGNPLYPIGSARGLMVNLENCSGCGVSDWGWQDQAYWLQQPAIVQFASAGTHTIRVQTREDGAQVDQIVLSSVAYLTAPPGPVRGDATIVAKPAATPPTPVVPTAGPYSGVPVAVPGRVEAENFDRGGDSVSYHDSTAGNAGGAYRATDVDLQACAEGGYNLGWTAAGEWLNYTVNVAAAGNYVAQLRVASPSGASLHAGFNTASHVWVTVAVPATGGWQTWTTVYVPVALGAGVQQMTLLFDTPGMNLNYVDVVPAAITTGVGGTSLSAVTWNIQIDDPSESHARVAMDMAVSLSPRPQIIVVQEAQTAMSAVYLDELQRQTGQVWHGVLAPLCGLGQWTGTTCASTYSQAVGIFTTFDIVNTDSKFFPYADCWQSARTGLRAGVNVNGTVLQVFTTHLQHTDGCANDALSRAQSMAMLKSWAANYPTPQIVGGDFNGQAAEIDSTSGMSPNFADVWALAGSGAGATAYLPTPTVRIDYWFIDASTRAVAQAVEAVPNTGTVSDHLPLRATFKIP